MANPEHLALIKQNAVVWNEWKAKSIVRADLNGAELRSLNLLLVDFSGANLSGAKLEGADLSEADLCRAHLIEVKLSGAKLIGANLMGADLCRADLSEVDLSGANLCDANIHGANLFGAILNGANLSGANLSEADLSTAKLKSADLRGAKLGEANLSDTDLSFADLSEAHLYGADLCRANFNKADITRADLKGAKLSGANLRETNLCGANFNDADLRSADLINANLTRTDLSGANLQFANLTGAHLVGAQLRGAHFTGTDLSGTDFTHVILGGTAFDDVDLSAVRGLSTADHRGPSTIGIDTLYKSKGQIPEVFLRGCGLPDSFINYAQSLIDAEAGIQFYSCFISHSTKDDEFARLLHARLQKEHIRVWFAPHDIQGGQKLHEQIDTAIKVFDKLLLLLSPHSLRSEWVKTELRKARKAERKTGKRKLFPMRLVDYATLTDWECFDSDSGTDLAIEVRAYFIPDFSNWKDHDAFELAFARLLKDLRQSAQTATRP